MTERAAIEIATRSEEETIALGERLARLLQSGDVVALRGELGAGKTCFVRGVARGLGIDPSRIHSPTFVLVHIHPSPRGAGVQSTPTALVHLDAYRLNKGEDLAALGWDRLFDGSNIVVIEWAERIAPALPDDRWDVALDHAGETSRRVRIEAPTGRTVNLGARSDHAGMMRCRTCGGAIRQNAPTAPFCSERCRLADLGRWFAEDFRISRPLNHKDLEESF